MAINYEKLKYLLHVLAFDIGSLVEDVLEDSEEDPHYSAVTATNMIKCYIEVSQGIGEPLPFVDPDGYLQHMGLTKEERLLFEEKRKKESEYYIGVQY